MVMDNMFGLKMYGGLVVHVNQKIITNILEKAVSEMRQPFLYNKESEN